MFRKKVEPQIHNVMWCKRYIFFVVISDLKNNSLTLTHTHINIIDNCLTFLP